MVLFAQLTVHVTTRPANSTLSLSTSATHTLVFELSAGNLNLLRLATYLCLRVTSFYWKQKSSLGFKTRRQQVGKCLFQWAKAWSTPAEQSLAVKSPSVLIKDDKEASWHGRMIVGCIFAINIVTWGTKTLLQPQPMLFTFKWVLTRRMASLMTTSKALYAYDMHLFAASRSPFLVSPPPLSTTSLKLLEFACQCLRVLVNVLLESVEDFEHFCFSRDFCLAWVG